jgi:DNA-binding transcriptional LysR family regulator
MMPSPYDLNYFRETALTLNMSRAAERLGIAQPSLSLAIQRIEDSLGEKVFFRSKRGLTLTQPGKQLLNHTNHLIHTWNEVKSRAIASAQQIQGRFVIGCHTSVALYSLSHFLPKALQDQTGLEVKLVHDLSRKITEAVISSIIDVGIVVNPVKHQDLIITKLATDDVTFWVADGPKNTTHQADVLIYDPDLIQTQALLKKTKKAGITTSRTIETKSLEVVSDLTAHGCGIGILPTRVAQNAKRPLRKITQSPVFRDEICLVIRSETRSVAAIKYLSDAIKTAFD